MTNHSAVIFDLDGTIADDEAIWHEAFQNVGDRHGLGRKIIPIAGLGLADSWTRNGEAENSQLLATETREEFMELVENIEEMNPREGFWELIEFIKAKGYLIGLATSSFWEVTELLLEKMGVTGVFDAMTTGEEVVYLKPDPEIYRLSCQKLGVEPEEVLVFEDAQAGVQAALACGCTVFKVDDNSSFKSALIDLHKEKELVN